MSETIKQVTDIGAILEQAQVLLGANERIVHETLRTLTKTVDGLQRQNQQLVAQNKALQTELITTKETYSKELTRVHALLEQIDQLKNAATKDSAPDIKPRIKLGEQPRTISPQDFLKKYLDASLVPGATGVIKPGKAGADGTASINYIETDLRTLPNLKEFTQVYGSIIFGLSLHTGDTVFTPDQLLLRHKTGIVVLSNIASENPDFSYFELDTSTPVHEYRLTTKSVKPEIILGWFDAYLDPPGK